MHLCQADTLEVDLSDPNHATIFIISFYLNQKLIIIIAKIMFLPQVIFEYF